MNSFNERRKHLAIASGTGVLLIGVILIFLNLLASGIFFRWDLTQHQAYSLSPASRSLVRSLQDPVVIKAYFTPDLPDPYNTLARYVKDILTEYHAASKGRVRFEFVPTQPPADFEQRANEAGMAPIQFQEMGSEEFKVRRGYMGLVFFYGNHSETLPAVTHVEGLEYDITSRIARMTRTHKKVIALTTGHGEVAWNVPQGKLYQDLSGLYDFKEVSLTPGSTAPIQADALLVVGPSQRFSDQALWTIDQAIMRGIPAAFLIDGRRIMLSQFLAPPQTTGLEDLLKSYGLEVTDQLVYDAQCEPVAMTQNMGGLSFTTTIQYPFVPVVNHLDSHQPILRGIEAVSLPFPARLESAMTLPSGVRFQMLLSSTEKSWLLPTGAYNLAPNTIPNHPPDPHGPFVLGGVLEGTFPSYFTGKKLPVSGATLVGNSPPSTIFVLGTSHLLDPSLPEFSGASALLTNLMAFLSHDDTLLGIRSKGQILRPLKPGSPLQRQLIKLLVVFVVPSLPALWGLVRWRRRERWRVAVNARFAAPRPSA